MKRAIAWLWNKVFLSTFLPGLLLILPIVITVAIMGWMGGILRQVLGPESPLGVALHKVGLQFVTDDAVASIIGWIIVLVVIWLLGLLVRTTASGKMDQLVRSTVNRIPVFKSIYGPVAQVVGMLKKDDTVEMQRMSVVFCEFGGPSGGSFLGLLASPKPYRFGDHDCYVVYIPTSPIPMSGGIVFVPAPAVRKIDMTVDDLMKIYFSLGVLSSEAIPQKYKTPSESA